MSIGQHPVDGGKTMRTILRDVPGGCLDSWSHNEWVVTSLCSSSRRTLTSRSTPSIPGRRSFIFTLIPSGSKPHSETDFKRMTDGV